MALIEDNSPALEGNFWRDALENSKILLYRLDQAIHELMLNPVEKYEFDDGQTKQNVTRHDLPSLIDRRAKILAQIRDMEEMIGIGVGPQVVQVVPRW